MCLLINEINRNTKRICHGIDSNALVRFQKLRVHHRSHFPHVESEMWVQVTVKLYLLCHSSCENTPNQNECTDKTAQYATLFIVLYSPNAEKNALYWHSYREFRNSERNGIFPSTVKISGASTTCHISSNLSFSQNDSHLSQSNFNRKQDSHHFNKV